MRILRLDLQAFGPFTNATIAPDEGQYGLHIIYGPNEAGKSSSLRALRQWLYGIPHNSADNFIHPYPDLRIGGVLEGADGSRLEFIRRKARTKTLRGPDDSQPVDDAELDRLLHGIDETAFSRRFGIDYDELRRGGHTVAHGGGELGELLFAAGAGVSDLGRIQQKLAEDAEALFRPRGSKQRINDAVARLKEAEKQVRDNLLPTASWKELDKAVRDAETRREDLDRELADLRKRSSRMDRVEEALPLLGQRRELSDQFAAVFDAPRLPDDFAQNRSSLMTSLRHEQDSERAAAGEITNLQSQLDAIVIPDALLARRSTIAQLKDDLGAWLKAQKDRPSLVSRKEAAEEDAVAILADLGKPSDLSVADELKISNARRQKIQTLAGIFHSVTAGRTNARQRVKQLESELAAAQSRLAGMPPQISSKTLRRAIRDATEYAFLDDELAELNASLARDGDDARRRLRKLPLFDGELEELDQLPVPSAESNERFDGDLRDAKHALTQAEKELGRLTEHLKQLQTEQTSLQLAQSVPSEADLSELRRRREQGWRLVLRLLDGTPEHEIADADAFVSEFAPGGNLPSAFRECLSRADDMSDRLRREADRVLQIARLQTEIDSTQHRIAGQTDTCSQQHEQLVKLDTAWKELWSTADISPLSPREMLAWLRAQQELCQLAATVRRQRQDIETTVNRIGACRDSLKESLKSLGRQPPPDDDGSLRSLLDVCSDTAEAIEAVSLERADCEKDCTRIAADLQTERDSLEQAEEATREWQSDWNNAVADLDLEAIGDPGAASDILQQIEKLQDALRERKRFSDRIDGIDTESAAFTADVRKLLPEVAPDLLERPVPRAVQDLSDRLTESQKCVVRKEDLENRLSEARDRQKTAQRKLDQIRQDLIELCELAGTDSVDALVEIEQRAARRTDVERQLAEVNDRLTRLAAGVPLQEFLAEIDGSDIDKVRADKESLRDAITRREKEQQTNAESLGGNRLELQRMNGQALAAEAQEQVELLTAEVREGAEEFIRLQLAAVVLRQAIERYREDSQGPVLNRASTLFSKLTLNSFSGLRAEFDDKGEAVLAGIRAGSDRLVHVDGMSEGTCDQLYLALRLALLEATLDSGRRMPFVVDDILIMFDDARAVAALQTFAELSDKTQVIFFTHHQHLLDLARTSVPANVLFIHNLQNNKTA